MDSSLSFDNHISDVCKSCNYHIRALRHVRPMLSTKITNEVACSIVASRLDYCNSLLFNVSASNIGRLQCLQNNLSRVVCNAPVRSSAPPLLHRLHWLPVEQRIKYKIACITHNTMQSGTPLYPCQAIETYAPPRTLRSSDSSLLSMPNLANTLVSAGKAFSVAAPTIWNSLSTQTLSSPNIDCLKKSLKTELFAAVYLIPHPRYLVPAPL